MSNYLAAQKSTKPVSAQHPPAAAFLDDVDADIGPRRAQHSDQPDLGAAMTVI